MTNTIHKIRNKLSENQDINLTKIQRIRDEVIQRRESKNEFMYRYDKIISETWKPTNEMFEWLLELMPKDKNINRWWVDDIEFYHCDTSQGCQICSMKTQTARIVFDDPTDYAVFDLIWG